MARKKPEMIMQNITTIHGTNYFTLKKGKTLIIWTIIMLSNVILTTGFLFVIKQKFNENQIITQINANCKVNQVPFPAVSICNFNMVSLRESSNIARVLTQYNKTQLEIEEFLDALPILKSYDKNSQNLGNFTEIIKILKHHYFTMDTIMEEVHQKCDSLLLYCTFNRKQKSCENIFILIKTAEGYCCTFNYAALNDASEVPLLPRDEDLEYFDDQEVKTKSGGVISTSESGRMSGLSVVLNVEPNDYPTWASVPYYGAKILITDPSDYPETSIKYRYITLGESVDIKVEAMVFQSGSDIRRVDPEKRECWFYDEVVLEHTNIYSHETCHTECKMKNYLQRCGCIPYKYPREKSKSICEFEDLKCLNNMTVHKSKMDMNCKPTCYKECQDKKYRITSDLVPFLAENFPAAITKGRNVSQLAALQVYFGKSNCNCYEMSLLIDVSYFIATYGGVFSLSFGGSIITLFELTYVFISLIVSVMLRLTTNMMAKFK